ncbi:Dyp-type peroxidase [Rhizobium panacihumi]|uniref:Dyp-type peroxidase n=1 Tax=Rhizobium panacihumi TaxID=2008450 RepID=UPI003D7A4572
MTVVLDLADIQGGILRAYGRQGFPKARYFFLTIRDPAKGRDFVEVLRPKITTAARWKNPDRGEPLLRTRNPRVKDVVRAEGVPDYPGEVTLPKPKVAINIAFTFYGLLALGVPTRTLREMPDEFIDGMQQRAAILGDDPFLDTFDPVWRNSRGENRVHVLVSMNAEMNADGTPVKELIEETERLEQLCRQSDGGVVLLTGNGPHDEAFQEMSAILREDNGRMWPTNKEHFQLSDGFGDPVFEGQMSPEAERLRVIGGGKLMPDRTWAPLATGEFLLGYADEGQEVPGAAMPIEFSRNGTFMAYRKLHENVGSFESYIADQGARYARYCDVDIEEGTETVRAKLVGRWEDGVPLMAAPTFADWQKFNAELEKARKNEDKAKLAQIALEFTNFTYRSDPAGNTCPVTSHLRRANPRDMLDPLASSADLKGGDGSALVNRRRILRRGLPYGQYDRNAPGDGGEHGIIFLAICTNLFRQFEFVQQQWIHYGLDFNAGSDTCPILGNHLEGDNHKMVITTDPASGRRPFICDRLPQLVEPRGGDYFFVPSMTSLRLIGMGIIDPT